MTPRNVPFIEWRIQVNNCTNFLISIEGFKFLIGILKKPRGMRAGFIEEVTFELSPEKIGVSSSGGENIRWEILFIVSIYLLI